ncbi:unnamed protein product [Effrenium voratum]|nr:unnamed protein product [Effrenium voratum]
MSDRHLPVISRPASPEFPSLVRSRVPSQSQPPLQSLPRVKASHSSEMSPQKPSLAASCPQLPGTKARMRREQEENNFLSRQQQHSGLQSRRQRSMMQRDILRKSQAAEDVEFLGSKGKEGFRTFLLKKFGTIISGWRALDADNSGRLGFVEFCQACRVVGFHGNFKKLWAELDVRGGMVCLADVDPEVSRYLSAFKKALVKKYGDLITAWFQCIDVHRDGQVQEPGFRRVVQLLGLDLNPSKLFNMLRSPSSKALTLLDFDPEAWKKHMAGEGPEGPEGPAVASSPKEEKKEKAAGFRQALSRRFGSLLHAWREELDPDGAGRVTFGEFCLVLSRLGLRGEVRSLWTELTKDETGFLSFRDLDPQTDQMVSELREKLTQEFQNMLLAWIKGLDTRGTGLVSEKQFLRCCQKVGFTGDAKDLFHRLKPDAGRSLMTIQDFDTKAFHALSRGDFRMLSEPAQGYHGKSPLELTFHERNEAGFFYQARRAADAARRKEFAKACRTAQPAFCINTIEDFEDLCIRKHGSLIAAWRQCLDAHANGKPGPQRPRRSLLLFPYGLSEASPGPKQALAGCPSRVRTRIHALAELSDIRAEMAGGQIIGAQQECAHLEVEANHLMNEEPQKPRQELEPTLCGIPMKWVSLVALTFQTTGQALLIKWSDAHGKKEYVASTVVFWTEVVKLITSLLLVIRDTGALEGLRCLERGGR